jgi:hypothetical protein
MFKEIILAIILGTLLGFGLTGGYFAIKKSPSNSTANITPTISIVKSGPTSIISPTPTEVLDSSDNQITIDSPENESIVSNSKLAIKGSTNSKSTIVITTSTKNYTTHADNAGNFSIEIDVETGTNLIQIDSIDSNDNQSTTKLLITYSTAKL